MQNGMLCLCGLVFVFFFEDNSECMCVCVIIIGYVVSFYVVFVQTSSSLGSLGAVGLFC